MQWLNRVTLAFFVLYTGSLSKHVDGGSGSGDGWLVYVSAGHNSSKMFSHYLNTMLTPICLTSN